AGQGRPDDPDRDLLQERHPHHVRECSQYPLSRSGHPVRRACSLFHAYGRGGEGQGGHELMREVARIALLLLAWATIAAAADHPHPFLQDRPPAIIGNPAADSTLPVRLGRPGHLLLACSTRTAREPEKA